MNYRNLLTKFRPIRTALPAWAFLALSTVVITLSDGVARQADSNVQNFYEDALERYEERDFRGAIIQLKNALKRDPENLPARILIGKAHLKVGDAVSAEKELRRARVEGADEEHLIVSLASALFLLKRHHEVVEEIDVTGRTAEVEAGLRVIRGQAYMSLSRVAKAEVEFGLAAELRPNAAMPHVGMARVHLSRGALFSAVQSSTKATDLEPQNFYALFVDGRIARRVGEIDRALEQFNKSIALQPNHAPLYIARARLLVETGRHEDAIPDLDYLLENLPNNPYTAYIDAIIKKYRNDTEGYEHALNKVDTLIRGLGREEILGDSDLLLLAGVVNYSLENFNDAQNFLRENIARDKYNAGARGLLGRILLARGATQDAWLMLESAVDLAPKDAELQRLVGISLMRLGKSRPAAEAFRRAIELDPNVTQLRTNLALSQLKSGKAGEAIAELETALEKDPDAARPSMMLGLILVRGRKYGDALEILGPAVERDPDNPVLYNLLASAQWGLGDQEAARRNLEKAIELNPNYLSAHRNLAQMDLNSGAIDVARARYQSMIDLPNSGAKPYIDLANISFREGNLKQAISLLSKAKERDPDNIPVQLRLVDLLVQSGDSDAALRVVKKLDNKTTDNRAVIEKLGIVELSFGKKDAAVTAFRRLAENVPDKPSQILRVARLQQEAGDVDGAHGTLKRGLVSHASHLGMLEDIIRLETRIGLIDDALLRTRLIIREFPDRAIGYRLRGDVLHRVRNFGKAALAYQAAIERQPSGRLFISQYRARRASGIERPSLRPLENWVTKNPKDYSSRRTLAAGYMHVGRNGDARELYEALLAEQPRDPIILNNLAWLYFEDRDDRALETAENAYRIAPVAPQTLDTYGWILVESGAVERGLELLRAAYARASREPSVRFHLASALYRTGQTREAKQHLEALLKADNVSADISQKTKALLAQFSDR